MSDSDPLLDWRSEFPIVGSANYLINNSLGAMPRATRDSLGRYLDLWEERGVRAWAEEWWMLKDEVGNAISTVLGVAPGTVSMHQNVAAASQTILSCFDFSGRRNKVVYTDMNFPSVMYLYEAQRARGAEIVRVPTEDGIGIDIERLLEAIDDETLLVPISHALFRSSFLQDAAAICAKARRVGAFVVLDVFQSVGCVPLHLADWGVHAAVGGALKFLCGGPGNGFLYVDPALAPELHPTFTGWSAHKDPFAFSTSGQDYRDDGGRFLNGTPNVPALYAGREGIRIIGEVGLDAIRARSQTLTGILIERATHHGFRLLTPGDPTQRAGHVSIDVPDGYAVCQALLAEDIVVDYRPGAGIRVAPHFFTRESECATAVDRIAAILANDEHHRFRDRGRLPG